MFHHQHFKKSVTNNTLKWSPVQRPKLWLSFSRHTLCLRVTLLWWDAPQLKLSKKVDDFWQPASYILDGVTQSWMDALIVRLSVIKKQKLLSVMKQSLLWVWQNLVPKEVSRVWSPSRTRYLHSDPLNRRTNACVLTFPVCQLGSFPAHTDYHSKALAVYFNQAASVAT